jgi:cell division inhibitor SulA
MGVEDLLRKSGVMKGNEATRCLETYPTGFNLLNQALLGGGWPKTGLVEILLSTPNCGALRLMMPLLVQLSQEGKWIILINPPHTPLFSEWVREGVILSNVLVIDFPESDEDIEKKYLWAYEQALKFHGCGIALFWCDELAIGKGRRLKLSAESGETLGLILRPSIYRRHALAASSRLQLDIIPKDPECVEPREYAPLSLRVTHIKGNGAPNKQEYILTL